MDIRTITQTVEPVMERVRQHGDEALREYTSKFDGVEQVQLKVSNQEIVDAIAATDKSLLQAIDTAIENITKFHSNQLHDEGVVETMPGVECWRQIKPIEKVGLYIPGGTAPLFSTILMLAIPARIAGCKEIILCTPPSKDGSINPAILVAAAKTGITSIFRVGGAQAIAALTYGTDTIPAVYKIFGPGNQYVTAAKQLAQLAGVAIDMPAGPSEVCVWSDESGDPSFVASDLLSQAEHGLDSQVLFITNSAEFGRKVAEAMQNQLSVLPRNALAQAALDNSRTVILDNQQQAIQLINLYAPEHLIICQPEAEKLVSAIENAGSIFIGNYTPESAGDYASGTNHTLPTNGYAKAWSGVSVDSFIKKITVQKISREGLQLLGPAIISMAEAEGLQAHANAVKIRLAQEK